MQTPPRTVRLSALLVLTALVAPGFAQAPIPRVEQQIDGGLDPFLSGASVAGDGDLFVAGFVSGSPLLSQMVYVCRSEDAGVTWDAPLRVDTDSTSRSCVMSRDSVRVAGDRVYVVWRDNRNGAAQSDLYFNRSTDGGLSFASTDRRLGDGAQGANDALFWRFAVRPDETGDDLFVLFTAEPTSAGRGEELFLVTSFDGGLNWTAAVRVGGDAAAGVDVDQLALVVDATTVHVAWEDDGGTGTLDDVLYQRSVDDGVTFLPAPIQLDASDVLGIGDASSGLDTGLSLAAEGPLVLAAWPEERTDPTDEEVRVAWSSDGGLTWAPDRRIGNYDPTTDDVDGCAAWVAQGRLIVAWNDARSTFGRDHVFVATSDDMGVTFTETRISAAEGGEIPRLSGVGSDVVVLYSSVDGAVDHAAAAFSLDGGATWSPELEVSDTTALGDADSVDGVLVPQYQNVAVVFFDDRNGTNEVFVGGFSVCDDGAVTVRDAGSNPSSLRGDVPRLGADWNASVDLSTSGHGFAALFGYATPANLPLPGGQTLLVNAADPGGELFGLGVAGGSTAAFVLTVPNEPRLCGISLSAQALHFGSVTPFALSNALDLVVSALN